MLFPVFFRCFRAQIAQFPETRILKQLRKAGPGRGSFSSFVAFHIYGKVSSHFPRGFLVSEFGNGVQPGLVHLGGGGRLATSAEQRMPTPANSNSA